jgi:dihydroneopterin aldolase
MDSIILRNLSAQARIGLDCWGRDRPQPVLITIIMTTDVAQATFSDEADDLTIDYSALGKGILNYINSRNEPFESLYHLVLELAEDVIPSHGNGLKFGELEINAIAPKQLLCTDGLEVQLFRSGNGNEAPTKDVINIKDLQANIILGVNQHERLFKQRVLINISIEVQKSFALWMRFLNMAFISHILNVSDVYCLHKMHDQTGVTVP